MANSTSSAPGLHSTYPPPAMHAGKPTSIHASPAFVVGHTVKPLAKVSVATQTDDVPIETATETNAVPIETATETDAAPSLWQRMITGLDNIHNWITSKQPTAVPLESSAPIESATFNTSMDCTTSAEDMKKTNKEAVKVVEFHQPNWKERCVTTVKATGSFLIAPLKPIAYIWQGLKNFVISPIHVGLLYLFDRPKYDARKIGLEAEAVKAEKECDQAACRTLEQAYQLLARRAVVEDEHKEAIEKYKPSQKMIREFHKKLTDGSLALIKHVVDPETGDEHQIAKAVRTATEQVLEADKAEVAKRLGNDSDPELRRQLEEYNQALLAHENAMEEHAKAVKKAEKNGECLPWEPILTAKPPVFKCTDKNVIAAYNSGSKKHLDNLQAREELLHNKIRAMRAELHQKDGDDSTDHNLFIFGDTHKTQVETKLASLQKELERITAYQAVKDEEDASCTAVIDGLNKAIDVTGKNLYIYEMECELQAIAEEFDTIRQNLSVYLDQQEEDISDREKRDRLNTRDWKLPVMKDKNGNTLEVFNTDSYGNIVVDKAQLKQATHGERTFEQLRASEYNGKEMPNPVAYKDQRGLNWSSEKRPYPCYAAARDIDGNILKGHVVDWWPARGQLKNHWVVKPDLVNGKDGYDKNDLAVKKSGSFFKTFEEDIPLINFSWRKEGNSPVLKPIVIGQTKESPDGLSNRDGYAADTEDDDRRSSVMSETTWL